MMIYSQFTTCMTSISENEMNIWISLSNLRHVNGMLNISLEIFLKKMRSKIQNTWETIVHLEIFMLECKKKL